jgi:RHS repeat-associated protein
VNYSYDNADRLLQITQGTSVVSFSYDAASRRTSLTLPDGIVTAYSYDTASELTGLNYTLGGNTLGNLAYSYDLAGRRTSVCGSFARTGIPLPVSTAAYNAANELTQWGTATLTYDADGNMLSDGTNSFVWDARNRLAWMNGSTISFQYDPFGRRVSKTISGTTTNYLYDGPNPAQELSGTTPVANLLTGGLDEYFLRTDASGPANFLTDPLESTLALADSAGAIQTQYTYEPFGNTSASGASSANPYQYTGREDDGTGLYFYRARYYDPALQRFISQDPLGFAANSVNFYELADEDPTNFRDPWGLQPTGVLEPPVMPVPAPPAPSPVAAPPPSIGIGLGNLLGAAAGIFAFPEDLNPNEPDPAALRRPRAAARNPLPGRKPRGNAGKQSKCVPVGYDKQLSGCRYLCDDGTVWFEAGPCKPFTYKPWGEGFPKYPPIPTAP